MIISRTPYRISFLGGGSDYPIWYKKYGGQVLSTSIDKYVYISCRNLPPFFKHKIRLVYSKIEYCNNYNQIQHPAAKAVFKYLKLKNGLEMHYDGDLPARSGIGSSSAFTVGALNAISCYQGKNLTNKNLAEKSIFIEQELIKENVGSQDQTSVAYGGFNNIKFKKNGEIIVKNLKTKLINLYKLENSLMLFHTGIFRIAETITKNYASKIDKKYKQVEGLVKLVDEGIDIIKRGNIKDFAKLFDETWQIKKTVNTNISNYKIDQIYNTAIKNGAYGGKLLGAGGGGFILFIVPKKNQTKVKNSLNKLLHVPFKFEDKGSMIIYKNEK